MRMRFTKMHGLGNDFVLLDGVTQNVDLTKEQARRLADRKLGVGCDQILIARPATDHDVDFDFSIINADGGAVGQCGNGARCLAVFVREQDLTSKTAIKVRTSDTVMTLNVESDEQVSVDMGVPEFEPGRIPFDATEQSDTYALDVNGSTVRIAALAIGNPHAVQIVDDIDQAPVSEQGPLIESHAKFARRVNAGYMQVIDGDHAKVRVYERGVGETMACGSGACAAVVAGRCWKLLNEKVEVELRGGRLHITWPGPGKSIMMCGPATRVYTGEIDMEAYQ